MPPKNKRPVFRVTGLQSEQSDEDLSGALKKTITENLSDDEKEIRFTITIVPSCTDDQRVALVEFLGGVPGFLEELQEDPLADWQVEMGDDDINFDRHFLGFTQLYTPDAGSPITADIIAITGLDGHAYGSWRGKGPLGRMWLRHFLSKDMPCCRTMIYGYNSKLSSHGISKIMDYGRELMEELRKVRNSDEARQRPLFFIAHSFGGIILTHCLIKAVQASEDDHPAIAALYKATYGMLLFGTPHKGLVVDDIQKMLAGEGNHPRSALLQEIREKSDLLAYQLEDFKNLIRDRKIVSFYETRQTRQLEKNTESNCWERTGDLIAAVDADSALLQLPDSLEEKIPVDADHSMIVKFDRDSSNTYGSARDKLKQFEKEAPEVVAARFLPRRIGPEPTIMIPFSRDSKFVGRESIITNIFELHATDYHSRVGLTGLGGVGKSQIAIEYAYRLRESSPKTWVFWVHAANSARFEEGYRDIADKAEIPERKEPKVDILKVVYYWLSDERHGKWLMILDNVDDDGPFFDQERPLEKFLPQTPNGRFIITSRNRTAALNLLGANSDIIEVEPMGEADALTLLKTKATLDESDQCDAKSLVQVLEYIPLAITHAGAYIKKRDLLTISDYIKLFEESKAHLIKVLGTGREEGNRRDNSMRHAVIVTWHISFAQIQNTEPSAADLLALMSMFDNQGIPLCWVRGTNTDILDFENDLTVLVDFSLVRIEIGKESAGMHRLVQLSMQKWLEADRQTSRPTNESSGHLGPASCSADYTSWARRALKIVSDAYPTPDFDTRAMCIKYFPHAYAVLKNNDSPPAEDWEQKADLLCNIGNYLFSEGRWKEAGRYTEEALILYQCGFGPEHEVTMITMAQLGVLYAQQCRWEEAEHLLVISTTVRKKNLGELHPSTLRAMGDLSAFYLFQGRSDEGESLLVQVYKGTEKTLGRDHERTARTAEQLAEVHNSRGRLKEAEELMLQALGAYKNIFGEEHPRTYNAMAQMGTIYGSQRRWNEAEELTLKAVHGLNETLGDDNSVTLLNMEKLMNIFTDQQKWDEAEKVGPRVLAAKRRRLGEKHLDTLKSMHNMAWIYLEQGKLEKGEELTAEVLEKSKEVLGEEHPLVLSRMNSLAVTYARLERYEEAERLGSHVVEVGRKVQGEDDIRTLTFMLNLARTLRSRGRFEEAIAQMRDVIERRERVLGQDDPDTVVAVALLAAMEEEQEQLQMKQEQEEKQEIEEQREASSSP